MRKTAKAMALLTAASMIMTAFTPVYAESTDDTAAVDWEKGDNIKAIKEKGVITVATGTYVPFEYRDDDNNIVGFDIDLAQYIADKLGVDMEMCQTWNSSPLFHPSRTENMIFPSQPCIKQMSAARSWTCPNPIATAV